MNYPASLTLPTVSVGSLGTPGATAHATPFSINLQCDSPAVVGITFDGAGGTPVKSAASGVFGSMNEGSAGVASGVGVQLVNDTTFAPMPLRVRNNLGSITANTNASYRYALRYYSLNGTPGAGQVSGAAVFTFDYQ
ncbi:Fimbrial protein [compost metagenome]